MIVTEAMLVSMEELQRHAADMENHVKSMMEEEGRRHGLELDRRRNARELWNELNKHMTNPPVPVAVDHEGVTYAEHTHLMEQLMHTQEEICHIIIMKMEQCMIMKMVMHHIITDQTVK